jgi:hypothetical protein
MALTWKRTLGLEVEFEMVDDLSLIGDVESHSGYELKIVHPLLVGSIFPVPVGNFACAPIKREALEREQRTDHVFSYALSINIALVFALVYLILL